MFESFRQDPHIKPREALYSAFGLVLFLEIIKEVARVGGIVATTLFTLAAVLQLYYPLWRVGRAEDPEAAVGLRTDSWKRELIWVAILSVVVFTPFVFAHHLYWTKIFHYQWAPGLPKEPFTLVLTHFLGVALPEEVFYRGFVQPNLAARFTKRWNILGASVGWEIPITSAIFALGHFAGEYDPTRLGPFFPGLLFGWLRARTGSVYAAIGFHALSNILSAFLFACYQPMR